MSPQSMKERLEKAYPEGTVEVEDLTGTEDHYQVRIVAKAFEGKPLLECHRAVLGLFDLELKSGEVHALSIKTKAKE